MSRKFFRCNTYEKQGGRGTHTVTFYLGFRNGMVGGGLITLEKVRVILCRTAKELIWSAAVYPDLVGA